MFISKMVRFVSVLVVGLCSVGFGQVDTIKSEETYGMRFKVNINKIGLVENNVMYASQAIDGDDVFIIDMRGVITGDMFNDTALLATIPRATRVDGPFGEKFTLKKRGNTLFFNDGNILKIYDVSDLKNPVAKHSIDLGQPIYDFTLRNDSIFVIEKYGAGAYNDFHILTYNYMSNPVIVSAIKSLGGQNIFINDKYYIEHSNFFTVYKFPLKEGPPDWYKGYTGNLNESSIVFRGDNAFSTSENGTVVWKGVNDFDNFTKITTLSDDFGEFIAIHKNLLMFGKNFSGPVHIFDISNINDIKEVAYWGGEARGMAIGPVTNLLYLLIEDEDWMDGIDLNPYIIEDPKTLSITSPNGNQNLVVGSSHTIRWSSTGYIDNVKIEYSTDNSTWTSITDYTANDGSYSWTVPDDISETVLVRVTDQFDLATDASDSDFAIIAEIPKTLTINFPNGGEKLYGWSTETIEWGSTGDISNVKIEVTFDGTTWEEVVATTENDGSYDWDIPPYASINVLVRISDTEGAAMDESDAVFWTITVVGVYNKTLGKYSITIKGSVLYSDKPIEAIRLYDLQGNMVWDGVGDAPGISGGVYIVKLVSEGRVESRKILVGK